MRDQGFESVGAVVARWQRETPRQRARSRASSRSPAALRARERRARQRNGVLHDLRVRVPTKRLVAAMRRANPGRLPEGELTRQQVEAELAAVTEAFIEVWIGPAKKPHA